MAIYIRLADIQPSPTLMGWILLGPINYRVGYDLKKKKPEAGLGFCKNLA